MYLDVIIRLIRTCYKLMLYLVKKVLENVNRLTLTVSN